MNANPRNLKMDETGKVKQGPGRPKGLRNRTTRAAKEAIELVAEGLGGVERMVEWCKEDAVNERAFWASIYPKLLPLQISGDPENPLLHSIKVSFE